jgi:hypothetical protein
MPVVRMVRSKTQADIKAMIHSVPSACRRKHFDIVFIAVIGRSSTTEKELYTVKFYQKDCCSDPNCLTMVACRDSQRVQHCGRAIFTTADSMRTLSTVGGRYEMKPL